MTTLYFLLSGMLLVAFGIIAVSFKQSSMLFSKRFCAVLLLMAVTAVGIYHLIQPQGLKNWLTSGKEHYQLQIEFEKLGGVKGAIKSVTAKLTTDPENIQAWIILGKLYLADHNEEAAQAAFARARELQK